MALDWPTLCKPQGITERHALDWNSQGTRNRGRTRTEWELQKDGKSWTQAKGLALDRQNQVEELHEGPMFYKGTKGQKENRIL